MKALPQSPPLDRVVVEVTHAGVTFRYVFERSAEVEVVGELAIETLTRERTPEPGELAGPYVQLEHSGGVDLRLHVTSRPRL